jgi:thiol-disulfide isomerase/thioredoxin
VAANLKRQLSIISICLVLVGCTITPASSNSSNLPDQDFPGIYSKLHEDRMPELESPHVVLFFSSPDCVACQSFSHNLKAAAQKIPSGLDVYEIDLEASPVLANKYKVVSAHTFVQLDDSGKEVHRWSGCESLPVLLQNLR